MKLSLEKTMGEIRLHALELNFARQVLHAYLSLMEKTLIVCTVIIMMNFVVRKKSADNFTYDFYQVKRKAKETINGQFRIFLLLMRENNKKIKEHWKVYVIAL